MRPRALVLGVAAVAYGLVSAFAQGEGYNLSRKGSLTIMPLYQRWALGDNRSFSELSSLVSVYLPAGREWSFSLRGAPASASGDITSLSSLSDVQFSIACKIERPSLAFTLGLNLPTGRRELTPEQFETSILLSNSVFNMQSPTVGLGFNVNPAILWAIPFSDDVVGGIGVAYHYHGKYSPLRNFPEYDPGDGFLVTGGFDFRLSEQVSLATDVVFWKYGKDKLGGAEVFAAGNKVVTKLQVRGSFNLNELWALLRYRSRAKSDIAVGGNLVPEQQALEPDQYEAIVHYSIAVNRYFSLKLIGEGRIHQETPAQFSGIRILGVGIGPTVHVSQDFSIPIHVKYQSGKAKGGARLNSVEAGLGVTLTY